MAVKRIAAENLIQLAIDAMRADIIPGIPADQRYMAAMIANALEIARRDILSDAESASWSLIDSLYPDGDGTAEQLARDIRAGRVGEGQVPELREKLRAMVVAELKVRNPSFLLARGASI